MADVTPKLCGNEFVERTSGCPTYTGKNPTCDKIQLPGAACIDFAATLSFGQDNRYQLFFNVRSLANKYPATMAAVPTGFRSWNNQPIAAGQH